MKAPRTMLNATTQQQQVLRIGLPVSLITLFLIIYNPIGNYGCAIISCCLSFLGFSYVFQNWGRKHLLSSKKSKEAHQLFLQLLSFTGHNDIVKSVFVIRDLARLMEADFYKVQDWLIQNYTALLIKTLPTKDFESLIDCVHMLTNHAQEYAQVHEILQLSREQLPEYLSSPNEHYRAAALARMHVL